MSTLEPLFTWIHLSDIHMGHGDAEHGWNQKIVLASLKEDIHRAPDRDVPTLDAILITGDLAFSGGFRGNDEYERVGQWLTEVAESVSIDKGQVFVIPGNHDVQRDVEEKDGNADRLLVSLRSGEESIDNTLHDNSDRVLLT